VARQRLAALPAGTLSGADLATTATALATHFHILPTSTAQISQISSMLGQIEATLRDSGRMFWFRSDEDAIKDGNPQISAAYAGRLTPSAEMRIGITRNFKGRSELNRVSSLIHEAVHVNDPASGTPATHISEWYVSPQLAPALGLTPVANDPRFATRYDLMSAGNALHNPASYATFARHVFLGVDRRELP
jgi:hypothetical protein